MTILVIEHHAKPSLGVVGDTFAECNVDFRVVWAERDDPIPEARTDITGWCCWVVPWM